MNSTWIFFSCMQPCNILEKICIFVNFGLDSQGCLWIYICKSWSWLWVNWGFGLHWACQLLMKTCNILDKICIIVNFGMDSQALLVNMHMEIVKLICFLWVNWGFGFHWACEFWVWNFVNNQNYLIFMIKLGFWFPLANAIGVLVSIGHKLIYFGSISNQIK